MNLNSNSGLNMFNLGNNSNSNLKSNTNGNFLNSLNNLNNEINNINNVINKNSSNKLHNDISSIITGYLDYSFSIWWFIIYTLIFVIFLF
tara:strand:+ start:500 stop:769 length:270 start_codon:yes stop_codon:yes gene_type:complete